ncbi:alpha/beta fold hydrolase [Roseateles toxinivorans]|uniref:Pimeloyl-ACP methyl ester carboxylesterase n=1 Tax=Roseateles toxinivorans TaxID=270368 RepID=A0A4R6QK73_9BURK|nr:alpha/beta fold hydrolase [Roseateles toxinivorans]TDP63521.1 pimeloyl-ACP methyl ester carboxylesterase [Roseateles toxinivorans]
MTTLVLLPGLGCDARIWADQRPLFEGHAVREAQLHAGCDSLPEAARALLDELPGDLLLCGASLGGMLALEVHAQAPQRVRGLALLGTSARPDTPERTAMRVEGIRLMQAALDGKPAGFAALLQANLPFAMHGEALDDKPLVARFMTMLREAGPAELIRQNRMSMTRRDHRSTLARVRCPTLVLCGDDDQVTPPEHAQELAANIAGAELRLIPRCGHMLTMEKPAAVNTALQGWLAQLSS